MKTRKFLSIMLTSVMALTLTCGGISLADVQTKSDHEPITIMDANRDYSALIELVHEKYPEINVQIEPYRGFNTSAYMKKQLVTRSMPDIYCTTVAWDEELQKAGLIDLSQYAISEMYNPARLSEYDVDGAVYLLPYDYNIIGIGYNKTLFEKNNIAIPTSFAQLRDETIPMLNDLGIETSGALLSLPGFGFQYFCNISDAMFLNTIEGRAWQKQFTDMSQDVFASDNENILACMDYFQQWIDCGMLNTNIGMGDNVDLMNHFREGNTAFFIGTIQRFTANKDGTGDEYGLLPYFSEDGTKNMYIVQNGRCYGISKSLEEPGNEQKLEDALHFLEVMSTSEGYNAIFGEKSTAICSIKDFKLSEDSPYAEAVAAINNGYYSPLIYNGWEELIVPFGEAMREMVRGNITGTEALKILDDAKREVQKQGSVTIYANVTEELDTKQAAQLYGQIHMKATNADAALVTYNVYYEGVDSFLENSYGTNGRILTGPMTEEDIVSVSPTGWNMTLETIDLTGAEINKLAVDGFDMYGDGVIYPYVFLTKDGKPLELDKTYKLVISGVTYDLVDTLEVEDTGMLGLDAAEEYFLDVGEVSTKTLDDSLVQDIDSLK